MAVAASYAFMLQLGLLSAEPALPEPSAHAPPPAASSTEPAPPHKPVLSASQLLADEPPGMQHDPGIDPGQLPEPPTVDPALIAQLGKTVLALVFVVVLIYLCAKLLPRMFSQIPLPGRNGQLKVLERTVLDAKHSVVLLQVDENTRLLLGTGDGVQLLTTLATPAGTSFRTSMSEAQREPKVS